MAKQGLFWQGIEILGEPYLIRWSSNFPASLGQRVVGKLLFIFAVIGVLFSLGVCAVSMLVLLLTIINFTSNQEQALLWAWLVFLISLGGVLFCRVLGLLAVTLEGLQRLNRSNDIAFLLLKSCWDYIRVLVCFSGAFLITSMVSNGYASSSLGIIFFFLSVMVLIAVPWLTSKIIRLSLIHI